MMLKICNASNSGAGAVAMPCGDGGWKSRSGTMAPESMAIGANMRGREFNHLAQADRVPATLRVPAGFPATAAPVPAIPAVLRQSYGPELKS